MRKANFENLLKILNQEKPDRPTLFEFFMNDTVYKKLAGKEVTDKKDKLSNMRLMINAFKNAGYDYATIKTIDINALAFPSGEREHGKSISLNDGVLISDRKSFEAYPWPDPEKGDFEFLDEIAAEIPEGLKLIPSGPGGVLENVIRLVGYDNLCFMTIDDKELAKDIFDAIGSRLVRYYEICAKFDTVGAIMSNDDWGFKTQPMLSPEDFRKYIVPWHRRIAEAAHKEGKPAILHSCGNLESLMDDIIDDIKYDGKHSYEDNICPVEEAYEKWGSRIAILGGLDLDFLCRSSSDEVRERSRKMLEQSAERGSYALGSGNSIPEYVPEENYFAMIREAAPENS